VLRCCRADIVIFPYMTLPLFGEEGSVAAVDEALARDRYIFLATQRTRPWKTEGGDLYRTGTVR